MKQLEILANEMVADRLNRVSEFVPVTGEKNEKKPTNGAYVLVHNWEPEVVEGEEGYDTWEVMRWFEAGAVVEAGVDTSESKSKSKLIRALEGKKIRQTIEKDGFYWQDNDDYEGPNEWHRIADENVDCWCELTGTGKGALIEKFSRISKDAIHESLGDDDGDDGDDGEVGVGVPEGESEELMFAHSFRLYNGTSMTIETIPSSAWKDGKKLPADVGAFAWYWRNRDGLLIKKGELSAKFEMPEKGHDWDTVSLAEQVLRFVMKNTMKISNPDGAYGLIR